MKKIFALLTTVVMLASLFTGVAFAVTPGRMVMEISVTGTVAINRIITIGGAVGFIGPAAQAFTDAPAELVIERLPIGADPAVRANWVLVGTDLMSPVPVLGGIIPPQTLVLTEPGTYRVALASVSPNTAGQVGGVLRNADGGTTSPFLTHTIGTVEALPMTVTPGITSAVWCRNDTIQVPVTITRVVDGVTAHVPIGIGPFQAAVSVTYAGVTNALGSNYVTLLDGTHSNVDNQVLVITRPGAAALSGTLRINVSTNNGTFSATASIPVTVRAPFNAVVTHDAVLEAGHPTVFRVSTFNAAGEPPTVATNFSYARATLTGPFGAPAAIVQAGTSAVTFASVTPRHGGTITATVEFFDAAHNVLHTAVSTFIVPGLTAEVTPVVGRRLDEVVLRAIVTDAAGARVPNAVVTFGTGGATFSLRDQATGLFTPAAGAVDTAVVNPGAAMPRGFSAVNGEYSVEALLRTAGSILVSVEVPVRITHATTGALASESLVRYAFPAQITVNPTSRYTLALTHTLLSGATAPEQVSVTVTNTADGTPVTGGITFTGAAVAGSAAGTTIQVGLGVHAGGGVWNVPIHADGGAGTFDLFAHNAATRVASTLEGGTTITAVAPVVAVTPAGGAVTSDFYDVVTVSVTDPRTNVPVARSIAVARRGRTAPNGTTLHPVIETDRRMRADATAAWGSPSTITASTQMFRILAHPTTPALSIRGAALAPEYRVSVGGAAAIDLALRPATLEATAPAALQMNVTGTVTVRLRDARGGSFVGHNFVVDGMVTSTTYTIPTEGTLSFAVRPVLPTAGAMPQQNIRITVTPDRAGASPLRVTLPVTGAAADTARPTIEVTAPSVTTDATAVITIVARDNVAVTGIIFEGALVAMFPGPTVTIMRTVALREGLNSFTLSVTDAAGNVTDRIIVIDRRAPAPAAHVITIGRANPAIGLDVPANVRNGRLMVPFRWFAERVLNATVDFRVVGAAEIVTLHRGNMHVELTLNSTIAKVNGVPVALDVAPFATGGRTLVPARFLAETFGYIVNWNPVNDEVTFTVRP